MLDFKVIGSTSRYMLGRVPTFGRPHYFKLFMESGHEVGRQIHAPGMSYAPTNEQGVVALFGLLARRLNFVIERVQVRYPDCFARYRGKIRRIEFEYRASNFRIGKRAPEGADIIVCWENDWESPPKEYRHLEIIDLKKYVNAEPRIFSVACGTEQNSRYIEKRTRIEWNVPNQTEIGDLVVIYRARDVHGKRVSEIRDLWKVVGPFKIYPRGNRKNMWPGRQGQLKLPCRLDCPVSYKELVADRKTRNLAIVRARFQGRKDITDDWPILHDKIVELNPEVRKTLGQFSR